MGRGASTAGSVVAGAALRRGNGGHAEAGAPVRRPTRRVGSTLSRWRSDDELREELAVFLARREELTGRRDWPSFTELSAAGRGDLRAAIRDFGGAPYWAHEFGLELRPGQERSPYGEADALVDAKRCIAEHGKLQSPKTVRRLGYPRLASYLQIRGGTKRFVAKHSL